MTHIRYALPHHHKFNTI